MARGSAAVMDLSVEDEIIALDEDQTGDEPFDVLSSSDGFKAITAYSIDLPRLMVICNDSDDSELRTRIRFNGGVFLCTQPIHVETLKSIPGIYFENMPAGVAASVCPKQGCRFAPRNIEALLAHIAKHID